MKGQGRDSGTRGGGESTAVPSRTTSSLVPSQGRQDEANTAGRHIN